MHTATSTPTPTPTASPRRHSRRWRVVDIVVAAVVAVAAGVIFWLWGLAANPLGAPVQAALPGLQGLMNGPWLFAGVLGGLIVRKPGAALFSELVAASVEALVGTHWGALTLLSGVIQGLGAELVFAFFLYRGYRWYAALLAGLGAGIAESVLDLLVWYPGATASFAATYAIATSVSAMLVAGLGSFFLVRGLARTGALARFAAGRESQVRV